MVAVKDWVLCRSSPWHPAKMGLPDTSVPNKPGRVDFLKQMHWYYSSRVNCRLRGLGVMNTEKKVCILRKLRLDC